MLRCSGPEQWVGQVHPRHNTGCVAKTCPRHAASCPGPHTTALAAANSICGKPSAVTRHKADNARKRRARKRQTCTPLRPPSAANLRPGHYQRARTCAAILRIPRLLVCEPFAGKASLHASAARGARKKQARHAELCRAGPHTQGCLALRPPCAVAPHASATRPAPPALCQATTKGWAR